MAAWSDPAGQAKGSPELSFPPRPDFPAMRLERDDRPFGGSTGCRPLIGLQLEYKSAGGGSDANIFNGHGLPPPSSPPA